MTNTFSSPSLTNQHQQKRQQQLSSEAWQTSTGRSRDALHMDINSLTPCQCQWWQMPFFSLSYGAARIQNSNSEAMEVKLDKQLAECPWMQFIALQCTLTLWLATVVGGCIANWLMLIVGASAMADKCLFSPSLMEPHINLCCPLAYLMKHSCFCFNFQLYT